MGQASLVRVCLRDDVEDNWCMLWQLCLVIDFLPLVELAHLCQRCAWRRTIHNKIIRCVLRLALAHDAGAFAHRLAHLTNCFVIGWNLDSWEAKVLKVQSSDEVQKSICKNYKLLAIKKKNARP